MSCPDWKLLAAHRLNVAGKSAEEPEGWSAALAHLDGCPACRQSALAADPTLLFRRVLTIEIAPAHEADEIESMRQAVAAMRTASRAQALKSRGSRQSWWRWSAAAALAVAALSLGSDDRFHARPMAMEAIEEGLPLALEAGADLVGGAMPAAFSGLESDGLTPATPAPVVEELGRPGESVYQIYGGKGLSMVVYINKSMGDI
jgi:hypothetical protein